MSGSATPVTGEQPSSAASDAKVVALRSQQTHAVCRPRGADRPGRASGHRRRSDAGRTDPALASWGAHRRALQQPATPTCSPPSAPSIRGSTATSSSPSSGPACSPPWSGPSTDGSGVGTRSAGSAGSSYRQSPPIGRPSPSTRSCAPRSTPSPREPGPRASTWGWDGCRTSWSTPPTGSSAPSSTMDWRRRAPPEWLPWTCDPGPPTRPGPPRRSGPPSPASSSAR